MPRDRNIVDSINRETMRAVVPEYSRGTEITPSESAAFASVAGRARGKRILDLGVGGGRTVPALMALGAEYMGVDYVAEMIEQCRTRFPGLRFEHADARSMPQFADQSFDLIVFACNGVSMVDHAGRLQILREVRRLLAAGGAFVFSTYNQACAEHNEWFEFPPFHRTSSPVGFVRNAARFAAYTGLRAFNRLRYRRHEIRNADYSIINDRCHNYSTMLYYISIENQLRQLREAGFAGEVKVYDRAGNVVTANTQHDSLTFVVTD